MRRLIYMICSICLFANCSKDSSSPTPSPVNPSGNTQGITNTDSSGNNNSVDTSAVVADSFVTYLIKQGNNYCEKNGYPVTQYTSIHFRAILDSSCIYTTVNSDNQQDINKLYGFADCSSFHQNNSARFGWDWYRGQMHIHAYCYSNTVRSYKELGTVPLNKAFDCSITVLPGKYIFTLNGKADTMERGCTDKIAAGYKLYPYFGGDETAPHDIRVKIREL